MKKTPLIIMCIAVLSLFCILTQAYAQDAGTGLFRHEARPLLNPAAERVSSLFTDPLSQPDTGMAQAQGSRIGLFRHTPVQLSNPALEMLQAMLAGSEPQPSEPPASNPDEQFGGWNPFSAIGGGGNDQNLWFGNANFAPSEP